LHRRRIGHFCIVAQQIPAEHGLACLTVPPIRVVGTNPGVTSQETHTTVQTEENTPIAPPIRVPTVSVGLVDSLRDADFDGFTHGFGIGEGILEEPIRRSPGPAVACSDCVVIDVDDALGAYRGSAHNQQKDSRDECDSPNDPPHHGAPSVSDLGIQLY
jgi:hypothetical protein